MPRDSSEFIDKLVIIVNASMREYNPLSSIRMQENWKRILVLLTRVYAHSFCTSDDRGNALYNGAEPDINDSHT